ncbi:C-X-C motif chemokine ligand 9 [Rhinolophus ferrumequinum]|uniref:C-X-C motif chemokine ligand 9 n=1 Tax=Rhinolophus ferrumequinum TaxID=59479 RepID=A0A7J7ZBD5_RHIFE|nr:C-X-C motif chemokine ligand 9 [Rhinolophus ferrumequinum]
MKKQSRIMSDLAVFSEPQLVCVWSLCKGSEGIEVKKVSQNKSQKKGIKHQKSRKVLKVKRSQRPHQKKTT